MTRPATNADRVLHVVGLLGLEAVDAVMQARIGRFIGLLGFDAVSGAAAYTASKMAATQIRDPWNFTVTVINRGSARASYLYSLVHWIEIGLRGGLEHALSDAFGPDWHRADPPIYLDSTNTGRLVAEYKVWKERTWSAGDPPRTRWSQDVVSGTYLPDYPTPEAFLETLDLRVIGKLVLHTYTPGNTAGRRAILRTKNGNRMPFQSARTELAFLCDTVRNFIAHNRPPRANPAGTYDFGLGDYESAAHRTEGLLAALGYDLSRAVGNHALEHMSVVDEALKRHGVADGLTGYAQQRRGKQANP